MSALSPSLQQAAILLIQARTTRRRLSALPAAAQPSSIGEAHAVQDAITEALREPVGGWKVSVDQQGRVSRGAMFRSRIYPSGATLCAADSPMLGIEVEVAFRFETAFVAREIPYTYEELAAGVIALPVVEIVDSRFKDYRATPFLDRLADHMSFGAFITGAPCADWRNRDLPRALGELSTTSGLLASGRGNGKAGDPLLPALAFVNALTGDEHIQRGQFVTTGSYTPLHPGKPGNGFTAAIAGLDAVEFRVLPDDAVPMAGTDSNNNA